MAYLTKLANLLNILYKDSIERVRINGEVSDSFEIKTGGMQGGIPPPILFNILFDFIDEAAVSGTKFSYSSNDFFHRRSEKHEMFDILALLYTDDLPRTSIATAVNDRIRRRKTSFKVVYNVKYDRI